MRAVIDSARARKGREAYAVNPNETEVQGQPAYDTVLDIPGPVELAIIVVPAAVVPPVMRQCVQKGVRAAVIISAGFAETDDEGRKLQAEVVEIAAAGGIHFVGPNCVGHADVHNRLASAGMAGRIVPGPLALLSQSGTLGASIMQTAMNRGIGISKLVSTGNEADLHLEDYLEYLATDDDTRVIGAYIEGLREARRFLKLSAEITLKKPIVVMKTGSTGESAKAARSHTGALSGADQVYSAAFKQAGVIRAEDEEELCDVAMTLLSQPLPRGNRVAILTMGGGFGVVTAEACEKEGADITPLELRTLKKLDKILPARWSHGNPVDLVGIRPVGSDDTVLSCLRALLEDDNVDCIISLLPPMPMVHGPVGSISPEQLKALQKENERNLARLNDLPRMHDKPLVFIRRVSFQPPPGVNDQFATPKVTIPEFSHPRRAARVIRSLAWYRRYLESRKS